MVLCHVGHPFKIGGYALIGGLRLTRLEYLRRKPSNGCPVCFQMKDEGLTLAEALEEEFKISGTPPKEYFEMQKQNFNGRKL